MARCVVCNSNTDESFEGLGPTGRVLSPCCEQCAQETKADNDPDRPVELTLDEKIAEGFECYRCESKECRTKRIATTGTGISKVLDIQHNEFIAVSCQNCGTVEFLDPKVLEESSNLGTIIDLLF